MPILASNLPRQRKLSVEFVEGLPVSAFETILRCEIDNRTVQALRVVEMDVLLDLLVGLILAQRNLGSYAFLLDRLVVALQFSVALGIKGGSSNMGHALLANELLEVLGDELRTVVGDDPWLGLREPLAGPLHDDLHIAYMLLLSKFAVHDESAAPIQNTAQIVKGALEVHIGHIDVPVLVRTERLHEPFAFARRLAVPPPQQAV